MTELDRIKDTCHRINGTDTITGTYQLSGRPLSLRWWVRGLGWALSWVGGGEEPLRRQSPPWRDTKRYAFTVKPATSRTFKCRDVVPQGWKSVLSLIADLFRIGFIQKLFCKYLIQYKEPKIRVKCVIVVVIA